MSGGKYNPRTHAPDDVRWFEKIGTCACGCGKDAVGMLRGPRNESYGAYAAKCAEKRLTKAKAEREQFTKPGGAKG